MLQGWYDINNGGIDSETKGDVNHVKIRHVVS